LAHLARLSARVPGSLAIAFSPAYIDGRA
jgi:hypothetical protein